jgi:hypothetical protein
MSKTMHIVMGPQLWESLISIVIANHIVVVE